MVTQLLFSIIYLGKKQIKKNQAFTWYHRDLVPQDSFDGKCIAVVWYQVFDRLLGRRRAAVFQVFSAVVLHTVLRHERLFNG